jgi:hypothetical protein
MLGVQLKGRGGEAGLERILSVDGGEAEGFEKFVEKVFNSVSAAS